VPNCDRLEAAFSVAADHLGGGVDHDVGSGLDGVDQVGRHFGGQVATADDESDTSAITRQVKHRLTGGVPTTHHHGVQTGEGVGLGDIRTVVDPCAGQCFE
jgi:hypothetical protein